MRHKIIKKEGGMEMNAESLAVVEREIPLFQYGIYLFDNTRMSKRNK